MRVPAPVFLRRAGPRRHGRPGPERHYGGAESHRCLPRCRRRHGLRPARRVHDRDHRPQRQRDPLAGGRLRLPPEPGPGRLPPRAGPRVRRERAKRRDPRARSLRWPGSVRVGPARGARHRDLRGGAARGRGRRRPAALAAPGAAGDDLRLQALPRGADRGRDPGRLDAVERAPVGLRRGGDARGDDRVRSRASSRRRASTAAVPSDVDRSAGRHSTWTRCSSRHLAACCSSRSESRATRTRPYPSAASRRAKAAPIPTVPPVTSAVVMGCSYVKRPAAVGPWRCRWAASGGTRPWPGVA